MANSITYGKDVIKEASVHPTFIWEQSYSKQDKAEPKLSLARIYKLFVEFVSRTSIPVMKMWP